MNLIKDSRNQFLIGYKGVTFNDLTVDSVVMGLIIYKKILLTHSNVSTDVKRDV